MEPANRHPMSRILKSKSDESVHGSVCGSSLCGVNSDNTNRPSNMDRCKQHWPPPVDVARTNPILFPGPTQQQVIG